MRNVLLLSIAVLIPAFGQAQASGAAATTEGLACFENLSAPEFPRAALEAKVDGSVWTTTHVTAQGTIDKIETQVVSAWGEGPKLLTPPVERTIRAAKLKAECYGKPVSVVFRYQLHGMPTPNPTVTSRTDAPNLMWIESQPAGK